MFGRRTPRAPGRRGPGRPEEAVRPRDWRSYDGVAADYERVRTPVHQAPARDLVEALALPAGGRVLDVGTGTGIAALAAAEAVGVEGVVTGIDPSLEMLRIARDKGVARVASAVALDLPFPAGTFDAVLGAFVVAFFRNPETALHDMIRVLRPGGRLGLTAWGPPHDEFRRTWREVAESYAGRRMLEDARRKATPGEEHFADPRRLADALRDAGLRRLDVGVRQYRFTQSLEDYLVGRETSGTGRFLREMLGQSLWDRFRAQVRETFRSRFPDPIGDTEEVVLGLGTKE